MIPGGLLCVMRGKRICCFRHTKYHPKALGLINSSTVRLRMFLFESDHFLGLRN